jgi:hypothetical protein
MKRNYIVLMVLLLTTCEERERSNPVDPDTELDPSEWAPSNLQVQVINDSQVKLTWTQEDERISGFRIGRKAGSGSFAQIAQVEKDVIQYTDTGLNYGTDYTYRVSAFTDNNESEYAISNTTTMTIPSPTNLTGIPIDYQSMQLAWNDNCSFELGYRLERSEDLVTFIQIEELDADVTEFTDNGLALGTNYTYRVKAFTALNESGHIETTVAFWQDCDGEWGGTAVEDCTGECNGAAVEDCTGECNGTAVEDCTGECNGTAVEDCAGECNGAAVEDCAGECNGAAVEDCNGYCDGTAFENGCGCVGGNTGLEEYFCYGCTDPAAINYDVDATFDDGSCEYDPDLLEEFSNISDWTIDLQCGSSDWTNNCSVNYSDWEYNNNGYIGSCVIANTGGYFYGTRISRAFNFPSDGKITFWYKGSSLSVYINYESVWSETDNTWTQGEINVSAGTSTISFAREGGAGETWLDELEFVR